MREGKRLRDVSVIFLEGAEDFLQQKLDKKLERTEERIIGAGWVGGNGLTRVRKNRSKRRGTEKRSNIRV